MSDPGNKISLNGALTVLGVSGLYVLYAWLSGGVRADQWQLLVLFLGCYFVGGAARRFILAFSVFLVYWWLYDSMKLYPNYLFKSVSIQELYNLEKKFFGFEYAGKIVMPSEYFQANLSTFLDVGTAIFYLCWIPVPLVFAFILFLKDQTLFLRFSIAFFIINLIGFVIYYLYPAAPPWYVTEYGFIHDYSVKSNPAGLLRFDQLIGFPVFEGNYSGLIVLDTSAVAIEVATTERFRDLMAIGVFVYLEVNYKAEAPVIWGIIGHQEGIFNEGIPVYDPGFAEKDEWNKIYFNLTQLLIQESTFVEYQISLRSILPFEDGEFTKDQVKIWLDNIKLVHF